jgi:glucose/arabinose dehydrogenase
MPDRTNDQAGTALYDQPPEEPAMRSNLLLQAISIGALALPLAACNDPKDATTVAQSYGPSPALPPPEHSWIPTVDIASVNRWPEGAKPTAANGMTVNAFASGLDHPRTVYVLPNGDVLVAESNAPPKPGGRRGSERQPHHAAARCRRRRRCRNA